MQLDCGGDGGEAEAGLGGVLEVGAGVREEDEGHCYCCCSFFFFGCCFLVGNGKGRVGSWRKALDGVWMCAEEGKGECRWREGSCFWTEFSIVRRVGIGRMMCFAGFGRGQI